MRNESLELPMSSARLRVTMVGDGWWRWVLHRPEGDTVLGADALTGHGPLLLERLVAGRATGEVDGQAVRWIFSLSEDHHCLYACDDGEDRLLYFQDRDGRIVWRDRLLGSHVREWSQIIGDLLGDRPTSR